MEETETMTETIARNTDHNIAQNTNSEINVKELNIYAPLDSETKKLLNQSAERLQLSARAYHRTIKLARTIADLEGIENITQSHILEALQYRPREI